MIIIQVEEGTLPLIGELNGGVIPKIDPLEHSCFIYHGPDRPGELTPTVMVGTLLAAQDYSIVEARIIVT